MENEAGEAKAIGADSAATPGGAGAGR